MENDIALRNCILDSVVFHSRQIQATNAFRYPVLNIVMDVSQSKDFNQLLRDHYKNILSVNGHDYLQGDDNISAEINRYILENFNLKFDQIFLQTIPKMFGYVFNPVSFWYCLTNGVLTAVLCEVANTFGEKHYYWLYQNGQNLNDQWLIAKKNFHVSPFFPIEGFYKFRFKFDQNNIHVDIQHFDDQGHIKLTTWIHGKMLAIKNFSLLNLILKFGWFTPMVIIKIHYQALKLFFKKVTFFTKPQPPEKEITHESSNIS